MYWESQTKVNKDNSSLSLDFGTERNQFGWTKWAFKDKRNLALLFPFGCLSLDFSMEWNQFGWTKWMLKDKQNLAFLSPFVLVLTHAPVACILLTGKSVVL